MESVAYTSLIRSSEDLQQSDAGPLEKVIDRYPYFATAHLLLAKKRFKEDARPETVTRAAIYSGSRARLKHWLIDDIVVPETADWITSTSGLGYSDAGENKNSVQSRSSDISDKTKTPDPPPNTDVDLLPDEPADQREEPVDVETSDETVSALEEIRELSEKIKWEQAKILESPAFRVLPTIEPGPEVSPNPDSPVNIQSDVPEFEPADITGDSSGLKPIRTDRVEHSDLSEIEITEQNIEDFDPDLAFSNGQADDEELADVVDAANEDAANEEVVDADVVDADAEAHVTSASEAPEVDLKHTSEDLNHVTEELTDDESQSEADESTPEAESDVSDAVAEVAEELPDEPSDVPSSATATPDYSSHFEESYSFSDWLKLGNSTSDSVSTEPSEQEQIQNKSSEAGEERSSPVVRGSRNFSNLDNMIASQLEKAGITKKEEEAAEEPDPPVNFPVTETFARILVNQGKREQAAEVYRQLSLRYPEKSSFFASQIKDLLGD